MMFLYFLSCYVLLILIIGLREGKSLKSMEAYFLANRQLPWWWATGSILASWFGAASTIVTFERSAEQGLSAFWWIGMPTLLTLLVLLALAGWIRNLPDFSIPDLMERFYGRLFGRWTGFVLTFYLATLAASQAVALGRTLASLTGWPYLIALTAGIVVVVIYTTTGGFRSVVITDIVQMTLIMLLLFFSFIYLPDSPSPAVEMRNAYRFDFFHNWETHLWSTLSFVLAWTISPIAWQRIAAIKRPGHVRKAVGWSVAVFAVLYSMIVIAGTLWGLSHSGLDKTLFHFIQNRFPTVAKNLAYLGILAAVMSTLDTALNSGAMMLVRIFPSNLKARLPIRMTMMISTLVIALVAFGVAAWIPRILTVLGLSSEIIAIGLFVPILATRWVKKAPVLSAWGSTLCGLLVVSLSFIATGSGANLPTWLRWPEVILPGLVIALLAYIIPLLWVRSWRSSSLKN